MEQNVVESLYASQLSRNCLTAFLLGYMFLQGAVSAENLTNIYTHENKEFGTLLKTFEQHINHKLNITWVEQSDLKARMVGMMTIRETPDVLITPSDSLGLATYSDQYEHSECPLF